MRTVLTHSVQAAVCFRAPLLSAIAAAVLMAFPALAAAENAPGAPAAAPSAATAAALGGEQVRAAILRAVGYLRARQRPDATWADYSLPGGVTALAAYALLQAGVPPEDPHLTGALESLRKVPDAHTYVVALKAMAFAAADPKRYAQEIQACADWLSERQHGAGGWGYGDPPAAARNAALAARGWQRVQTEADIQRVYGRSDASNTQFAVLGLHEAARAGAHVPREVWQKADRLLRAIQSPAGGWGYAMTGDSADAYGSMTAAALASLYICNERLAGGERPDATADRMAAAARGIAWIEARYTLNENPGRGLGWYYFWLYSLERAGVLSGRRTFGGHDWFREGAALLVQGQRPDGAWTDDVYPSALGLLFLVKGYKPLLAQRLTWAGAWRADPRDLDHLARFLDTRVGGKPVAWQTLAADAPLADYLAAPILHVAGRGTLALPEAARATLRAYVEQGGLVLFDAERGDAAFAAAARRLAEDLFGGAKFEPLVPNHPLYVAAHQVKPAGLEVLATGCRASVVLAPKGLGDGWAAADPAKPDDALRLGENLALYATGSDPLPDRLQVAKVLRLPPETEAPRGVVRIGQVQHDGDWQPRPFALPALLKDLAERFGLTVLSRPVPVRLADPDIDKFPILYMTGHYTFTLTAEEKAALKGYLERGGVLWAEACCGRAAFDKALRDLVKEVLPESPLAELAADHPLYSGKVGTPITKVAYSDAVKNESPDLARPVLLGAERGGHLVVVYSPYGIAAGLDGLRTFGSRCLAPDDAKRLAENIVLYALTY